MNSHFTYLLVDVCCLLFPFIFSFHPKIKFSASLKYFWKACLLTTLIFLLWDVLFTKAGIWSFNPKYVTGIYLLNLPIEEVLFFICIPYACVFTYFCLTLFVRVSSPGNMFYKGIRIFAWLLFVTGCIFYQRLYTSITFVCLAGVLFLLVYRRKAYLKHFFLSYLLILIPFFISNGILTGAFTAEPVVIYNGDYNLGIRIGSIPFEDFFYGMFLLLLNTAGYEQARTRVTTRLPS